jgi:hypothetical protein
MPAADHRLTTIEMAQFVSQGFLRFDALVPSEINEAVLAALPGLAATKIDRLLAGMGRGGDGSPIDDGDQPASLTPLSACHPDHPIGDYLRLPEIQGIITSLVGPDPLFDHDFVHHLPAGHGTPQHLHPDAIVDSADPTFDVQLFYFPHDVAPGGGGTRYVPGTHVRRTSGVSTARYQHIAGDEYFAGPAGTVLAMHHGIWHAGSDNPGATDRWMYKIRLNPTVPQVRLWNLDDFDAVHNDPADHVFATARNDSVASELRRTFPWEGINEARYDLLERIRMWRHLSGDPSYDADYYLTRIEQRAATLEHR